MPSISVIIPCYNSEEYLNETLTSVLSQTFTDIEIICINDGSTDGTLDILNKYAEKDFRIKVFSKPNGGLPSKSLNYGLDRSQGKYVFGLGHDDYLSSDALEKMYARAEKIHADAVLPDVYSFIYPYKNKPNYIKYFTGLKKDYTFESGKTVKKQDRSLILSGQETAILAYDWKIHAWCLCNGDLLRSIRYEEFSMNSDEYSARVFFSQCGKVAFSDGIYFYRIHSKSICKKPSSKLLGKIHTAIKLYEFYSQLNLDQSCTESACLDTLASLRYVLALLYSGKISLSRTERKHFKRQFKEIWKELDHRCIRQILAKKPFCLKRIILQQTNRRYYICCLVSCIQGHLRNFRAHFRKKTL